MPLEPQRIKQTLEREGRPLGVQELLRASGLHPGQQTVVKRILRELVRTGEIQKEGKRYSVERQRPVDRDDRPHRKGKGHPHHEVIEGVLHVHRDGFGFVHPSSGEGENIYLPPPEAQRALDNDKVRVSLSRHRGRVEGRLVEVVERRREMVVGTYALRGDAGEVLPNDTSLPGPIHVPPTQLARDGDLVKVRLGVGADLLTRHEGLFGEVAGSLGKPGDPSGEVLSIAFSQGFSDEFPPGVMDQADRIPLRVSEEEARGEGRKDLRQMSLVTIDGEDARDFDDAVWAERRSQGWRLVVAIADVTHYVHEGSPVDREALRRATSVYLPNRVLPMLPERLSNGICSLRPDEDRLCMVADMEIDRRGQLRSSQLYAGVMRSAARCTYNEVQAVLDGEDVPHRKAFRPQLEVLMELARTLTQMRERRGAIDFDLPEVKVVLDESGTPVRMEKRDRKDAHRLIEECMLAANEAVAKFFQDEGLPSVYRYHGDPDEEKLAAFAAMAQAHGFSLGKKGEEITSKELSRFVKELAGHPQQRALNQLLLRSMMQAVYSSEAVGHYGLGAEHYLHFTSPIRRYPDLLVHRLLKAHWARSGQPRALRQLESETARLQELAAHSSERERAAMQVEREVVSFYSALLMKDRVGEEFAATVASVTDFGFFVELDQEHVEGLVKGETLGHGFRLDAVLHMLVYAGTGRKVRVGQKLTVRLVSVNLERRQLDFEVVAFAGEEGEGIEKRGKPEKPPRRRPSSEAEAEALPASPHPGFDRLRALAAKQRKGAPAPDSRGAQASRKSDRYGTKPSRPGEPGKSASAGWHSKPGKPSKPGKRQARGGAPKGGGKRRR